MEQQDTTLLRLLGSRRDLEVRLKCWGFMETKRVTSEFKQGKIQGVWSKVEAVRVGRSQRPMTLDKGSTVRGRRKDESQAPG